MSIRNEPHDELRVGSKWFSYDPKAGATNGKGGTRNVAHAEVTAVRFSVPYKGRFPRVLVTVLATDGPNAGFATEWGVDEFARRWRPIRHDR